MDESEKSQIEDQTKVKELQKSCPPKTIKQIEQCLEELADSEKTTKEQKSSSTEQ